MTFTISAKCFTKLKLHAYKYPQCEVTGVLLAHTDQPSHLVEAIPLFHQGTRLIPMLEVAFEPYVNKGRLPQKDGTIWLKGRDTHILKGTKDETIVLILKSQRTRDEGR